MYVRVREVKNKNHQYKPSFMFYYYLTLNRFEVNACISKLHLGRVIHGNHHGKPEVRLRGGGAVWKGLRVHFKGG